MCLPGSESECNNSSSETSSFQVPANGYTNTLSQAVYCPVPGGGMPIPENVFSQGSNNNCFYVDCSNSATTCTSASDNNCYCPCATDSNGEYLFSVDCAAMQTQTATMYGLWTNTGLNVTTSDTLTINTTGNIVLTPAYGLSSSYNVNQPAATNPCQNINNFSSGADSTNGDNSGDDTCSNFINNCSNFLDSCYNQSSCGIQSQSNCTDCVKNPFSTGCGSILQAACTSLPVINDSPPDQKAASNCLTCINNNSTSCTNILTNACNNVSANYNYCTGSGSSSLSSDCPSTSARSSKCIANSQSCNNFITQCLNNSPSCSSLNSGSGSDTSQGTYASCLSLYNNQNGSNTTGGLYANNNKGNLVPFYLDSSTSGLANSSLTDGIIAASTPSSSSGNAFSTTVNQTFYPGQTVTFFMDGSSVLLDQYYNSPPSQYSTIYSKIDMAGYYSYLESFIISPPIPLYGSFYTPSSGTASINFSATNPGSSVTNNLYNNYCNVTANSSSCFSASQVGVNPNCASGDACSLQSICSSNIINFSNFIDTSQIYTTVYPSLQCQSSGLNCSRLCTSTWNNLNILNSALSDLQNINASDNMIYVVSYINNSTLNQTDYQAAITNLLTPNEGSFFTADPSLNNVVFSATAGSALQSPPLGCTTQNCNNYSNFIAPSDWYVNFTSTYLGQSTTNFDISPYININNNELKWTPLSAGSQMFGYQATYTPSNASGETLTITLSPPNLPNNTGISPTVTNLYSQVGSLLSYMNNTANPTGVNDFNSFTPNSSIPSISNLNTIIGEINNLYQNSTDITAASPGSSNTFSGGVNIFIKSTPLNASQGQYLIYAITSDGSTPPAISTLPGNGAGYDYVPQGEKAQIIPASSGTLWLAIYDPTKVYEDNQGAYTVTVNTLTTPTSYSGFIATKIIAPLQKQITKTVSQMYDNFACHGANPNAGCVNYLFLIRFLCTIYIITTGIGFIFGLIKISQQELVIRLFKLAIVMSCTNYDFMNYVGTILPSAALDFQQKAMTAAINGNQSLTGGGAIAFIDPLLQVLLSMDFFRALIAIITNGIIGLVSGWVILSAIFYILCSFVDMLKFYLKAIMFLSFVVSLGPIFIPFLLFNQTRYLFDKWWKFIIQFSLEPIILVTGLVILTTCATGLLMEITNLAVCFKCMGYLTPSFDGVNIASFCIPGMVIWGITNIGVGKSLSTTIDIGAVIILYFITFVMKQYVNFVGELASYLLSGMGGGSVSTTNQISDRDLVNQNPPAQSFAESIQNKLKSIKDNREDKEGNDTAAKARARGVNANNSNNT